MRDLAETISAAFSGVPKPAGLREIAPHVCAECDALGKAFSPYDSRSLPGPVLEAQYSALPLLSPAALHHYLPAYMLYALAHPDSNVLDFTVYHLVPSAESLAERSKYFRERFGMFNAQQCSAIAAFLSHVYATGLFAGPEPRLEHASAVWPNVA